MHPQQRMTCMLRAVGRAARADPLAPALDPAACAACGPLTLSLLTVRFLRRLELLDEVASSKAATPCTRGCNPNLMCCSRLLADVLEAAAAPQLTDRPQPDVCVPSVCR